MRTVVIETGTAPKDLVRFTEVRCLFDYENEWTGFFDRVVFEENADDHVDAAWRIRAGQYITSTIRHENQQLSEHDLRLSTDTIDYDTDFSFTKRMPQYQGLKQEYIFENYMAMVLKSRKRMLYLSNNDPTPEPPADFQGECWLPASGTRAYSTWLVNAKIEPVIYDINPDQLEFARWLNQQAHYPTQAQMMRHVTDQFHRPSIAEPWRPTDTSQWHLWRDLPKRYECRDILAEDLHGPTDTSNIARYLPCHHRWGTQHITAWLERNRHRIW